MGKEIYQIPALSIHYVLPKVGGGVGCGMRGSCEIHSLGHRLTKRLRPNHRTIEYTHFSYIITTSLKSIYQSSFCPVHHIWLSTATIKIKNKKKKEKILLGTIKRKHPHLLSMHTHTLKRQNKHKNQTQM